MKAYVLNTVVSNCSQWLKPGNTTASIDTTY